VRRRHLEPAVAELPGAHDHDGVAGRERVDERRLHRPGSRARERQHVRGGLEESLEAGANVDEERLVLRCAVVDDRLRHGEEDLARDRRRPRRHQLILLHPDGLLGRINLDSMVARPSTAERPSAVTKIASLPSACGEKNSTTSRSKNVSPEAPNRWAYA